MRLACAHLPEVEEQRPRLDLRWRIRGQTLVSVGTRDHESAPVTAMTVHAAPEEIDALVAMGHPFYPGWGGGLLAMVLTDDDATDWDEVKELVTESYCRLAPKKLVRLLDGYRRAD